MAGGQGSRLYPLTKATNKHLLPIFDKPLIYYPLTTLMLAGIREICLISSPHELPVFKNLLGDGSQFGIAIEYLEQNSPKGIADGLIIAADFIEKERIALILGDNLFHGNGLGRHLNEYTEIDGAQVFAYQVKDPSAYGIVEIGADNQILSINEKPKSPKSNLAVTGLYFYDNNAIKFARSLEPSPRGELEITGVNQKYLELGKLKVTTLSRGNAWLDTGTFAGLHDAASYVRIAEERQNLKIGDPREAAEVQGWIE
jgi:glucose-1-phosphate thymidylyltransferase